MCSFSVSSAIILNQTLDGCCHVCLVQAMHFFKVGQQRAQGKTMLLCLAQQLAEKLPGFAPLLLASVKELVAVGSSMSELSLLDTFEK